MLLLFLGWGQFGFQENLLDQVVVLEGRAHLDAALLVVLLEVLQLLPLRRTLVKHIWVEEGTDVLVVSLKGFQNQQRRNDEEDLRLTVF